MSSRACDIRLKAADFPMIPGSFIPLPLFLTLPGVGDRSLGLSPQPAKREGWRGMPFLASPHAGNLATHRKQAGDPLLGPDPGVGNHWYRGMERDGERWRDIRERGGDGVGQCMNWSKRGGVTPR